MVGSAFFMPVSVEDIWMYIIVNQEIMVNRVRNIFFGPFLGISKMTVFHHIPINMSTVLLLVVSGLACFALFYKAIEWFEHI